VVLAALLYVWGELHADLREATYKFLRMQGMSVLQALCLEGNFSENWSLPKIFEMAGVFQAQYPGFNPDDVVLMLCCLTGHAPLPAHGEKSFSKEGATTKWQQWLEELYALPAEALEWDTVTDFVETVKQLGEAKRKEREAVRNSLRAALKTLVTDTQQELAFFGMVDIPSWNAEACALTEVAALTKQVEHLYASLVEYRSVYQRPTTTLAEELQRRETLVPLEAAIQQTYHQLIPVFTVPLENSTEPTVEAELQRPLDILAQGEIAEGEENETPLKNTEAIQSSDQQISQESLTEALPSVEVNVPETESADVEPVLEDEIASLSSPSQAERQAHTNIPLSKTPQTEV